MCSSELYREQHGYIGALVQLELGNSQSPWPIGLQGHQKREGGGHYAFTTTVYPDIWVILGDVNQSGRPVYQNVAHEKLLE